jgi:cytochrome c oxidase subunit IV
MLVIAITISAIAAWYSVAGLTAIFSAAVIPVIIMGGALEAGKIVATVWLHNNWQRVSWAYKTYLVPAIVFLMLLTSMGIFGFLSKAHSDQSLVSGDAMSKIAIYDEKIAAERDNITAAKRALEQMNTQVDQMMGRTDTDRGAERAVSIRRSQAKERANLQAEITRSQKAIQTLQEQAAPLRAEFRKVEAEVGPIKYIAAFVYGDNPDQNVLERAVRWVIILIVIVFDPLALCLILAANKQLEWARAGTGGWIHDDKPAYEADAGPLTDEQVAAVKETAAAELPTGETVATSQLFDDELLCPKCGTALTDAPGIGPYCPNHDCDAVDGWKNLPQEPHKPGWMYSKLTSHPIVENNLTDPEVDEFFQRSRLIARGLDADEQDRLVDEANAKIAEIEPEQDELDIPVLEGEETWAQRVIDEHQPAEEEQTVPETTVAQEQLEEPPPTAPVDEFNTPIRRGNDYAVRYKGKVYNLDAFNMLHPDLAIRADNDTLDNASQCGFGDRFPDTPLKGDMWIRTDYLPERLFKWNGTKWIEVDKDTTDSYTYNQAYIQHLINKLEAGEYEIEDLNDAEQAQVEQHIEEILKNKRA